jgi:hypothetical protein
MFLITLITQSAVGAGFTAFILDGGSNVGTHTSITLDSQGQPHITYYKDTGVDMKYIHLVGSTWIDEVARSSGGISTSLALDAGDQPHVALYDPALPALIYAYKALGMWRYESVTGIRQAGESNALALDATGQPRIAYYDHLDDAVKYAVRTGPSTWSLEIVETISDATPTSLALAAGGEPRICYSNAATGQLRYAAKVGGSWTIETVGSLNRAHRTSLRLTSTGEPRIAFIHTFSPNNLRYATRTAGAWLIETVGSPAARASLSLTTTDQPRIAYLDSDDLDLKFATKTGGTWSVELVDPGRAAGGDCSLVLDPSDNPYISYFDAEMLGPQNGDLRFAKKIGGAWQITTLDEIDDHGSYTSIALDQQGCGHVSYYDSRAGNLKYSGLCNAVITTEVVDGAGTNVGTYTSIAIGSPGPCISYHDATNQDLKYATRSGSVWASEVAAAVGNVGQYTALAIGQDGVTPHISFYDAGNGDLLYASKTGAAWTTELADATGNVGLGTSIDLDLNGVPHISYYDETNGDLKHAVRSGGQWMSQVVHSTGDVGRFSSLRIVDGQPAIAFYDVSNRDLLIAEKVGGAWQVSTVDSQDDAGEYCSMARGATADDLRIAYYSATQGELRHARRVGVTWGHDVVADGVPATRDVGRFCSLAVGMTSVMSYYDATFGYLMLAGGQGTVDVGKTASIQGHVAVRIGSIQRRGSVEMFVALAQGAPQLKVWVFDVGGRKAATLWNGPAGPGDLKLTWDAGVGGSSAPAGVYWVVANTGREQAVRRMVLLH